MKKCFALLLTLLLALGLTATAFAVEGETPTRPSITVDGQTYEDITEVPITKLYQLVNDGAVSPAETFRFSIAAGQRDGLRHHRCGGYACLYAQHL